MSLAFFYFWRRSFSREVLRIIPHINGTPRRKTNTMSSLKSPSDLFFRKYTEQYPYPPRGVKFVKYGSDRGALPAVGLDHPPIPPLEALEKEENPKMDYSNPVQPDWAMPSTPQDRLCATSLYPRIFFPLFSLRPTAVVFSPLHDDFPVCR